MSNSPLENPGKTGVISSPTIGFRFHSSNEELEELQSKQDDPVLKMHNTESELKLNTELLASDYLDPSKSEQDRSEAIGDAVKDIWNLLGRKSASVDSTYESPFSNPIETWRKLNELKGKITKTVEEKISEMKIDRNVLGKSSRTKLSSSKENSSISDSEDTSESSKQSELWKDAEDANSSSEKTSIKNLDLSLSSSVESAIENTKTENEIQGNESELRNRKSSGKVSDVLNVSDIKIATANIEFEGNLGDENFVEDIESGVEADEALDSNESGSFHLFNESVLSTTDGSSSTPPGGNNVHWRIVSSLSAMFSKSYTIALMIGICVFLLTPLSDFLKGFLLCFLLLILCLIIKSYLRIDNFMVSSGCTCPSQPVHAPDSKSSLKVPKYVPVKGVWINEYEREIYDPDYYSVTHTVPAYLELDNSTLKLSRPKGKINKRATFDEPEYKMHFTSQRIYNISGCNVFLMPEGLTRKRLFSKKYPIVIYLRPDSLIAEKRKGKETDDKDSSHKNANKTIDTIDKSHLDELVLRNPDLIRSKNTLYLFARCDRQKEEWYRRLLAATRLNLSPNFNKFGKEEEKEKVKREEKDKGNTDGSSPSTPFESLFFDDDEAQREEYLRYMSKYVDVELVQREINAIKPPRSAIKKMKTKKKDGPAHAHAVENVNTVVVNSVLKKVREKTSHFSESVEGNVKVVRNDGYSYQVHWFNAFINRILFDVFRSPYWLDKIHDKVQKKLNSIRLPYYIEDIEVIEMDLGKTGPTFHRVSQPYLDERGLWFDMDTNFDGLIKVTIQTHLNLVKLQKGMEEYSTVTHKPEKGKKMQKEVRDGFLIKESNEKSTDCVKSKSKKLEKNLTDAHSKPDETRTEEPSPKSADNNQVREFKSPCEGNIRKEIEELAKIAFEESLSGNSEEKGRQEAGKHKKETIKIRTSRSPIYDSELEDSAESSDEEDEEYEELSPVSGSPEKEEPTSQGPASTARRYPRNRRSSKKIFRVFENVAQSRYFKTMAQSKYIQKAIAGVSATKLKLSLEIKGCTGILTINIPPPPSDRFWYGFRQMPDITLSANPKIGDKAVGFTHIKNYLQKRILREIKKTLVVPNMIDFVLPTSSPARSPSSLQIEQPDLDEQEPTTPSE